MEREGEVVGIGRRGGVEMRRRRGIIVGGVILSLLMGCNNGIAELEKKNEFLGSVVNLGNEFLNVFTSFGEMAGSALGFKKDPKKSDVRDYFDKVKKTVEETKKSLEKIVTDMKEKGNPNVSGTETAVTDLNKKLDKIIDGAKTASGAIGAEDVDLGNVAPHTSAQGSKGDGVKNLVKGIKDIVDVVLGTKEGNAEVGDNNKATDLSGRTGGNAADEEAGKLFNNTNAGNVAQSKKAAADAAKAVGAVTGADILQAIFQGESGGAFKLADAQNDTSTTQRDAVIAGAIALRAMAKGGKFAGPSLDDSGAVAPIVKGAAVGAVTKALDTLTLAIRKTIDEGLKKVKEAMKINPENTPMTTEVKSQ